ncbi:MAG: class I SAM-dependent methyltransferase [Actinomycetota bacterium]|nr:class I SAM-dependent methyltransferase [Actinomycetota bacterium]
MTTTPTADDRHQDLNQVYWTSQAGSYADSAVREWAAAEPHWGLFRIPEAEVEMLADVDGRDVVELGCGTAYVSAWCAQRGARPVGVDLTPAQLATARAMQRRHGLEFPLVRADGECVPLADGSFDLAINEYGAVLWCDPDRWLAEAARLLRPGGELRMLTGSFLLYLCADDDERIPAGPRLQRSAFGVRAVRWDDTDAVEFHLSHGDWVRALRRHGFEVLDLRELRVESGTTTDYRHVRAAWASRWPCEEVWFARRA